MTTARLVLCFLLLFLFSVPARSEPFEVWETAGIIYGRDTATGEEWRLSQWDEGATDPDVDGNLAVWLDSRIEQPAIYGYQFNAPPDPTGTTDFILTWSDSYAPMSEPHAGWIGDYRNEWAYVVWREGGDIWHWPMRWHRRPQPLPIWSVVLEDYSGPFDVSGRTLTYDGGTLNLNDYVKYPDPAPEPSGLLLLLSGLPLLLWHLSSRRG